MVFHVTNYMRETNVWMIRKGRWMLWGFVSFIPLYRNFYWDYLSRRVAFKNKIYHWMGWTDKDLQQYAEEKRANWGYKPRYEPVYDFSIKKQKHNQQTREDYYNDTPRLHTATTRERKENILEPKDVRMIFNIVAEHNRQPGVFDYNYP